MPVEKVEISVTTQSQVMKYGALPQPVLPKITMNGTPVPAPAKAPSNVVGWQLLLIDSRKDIKNPANFLLNEYLSLRSKDNLWSSTYHAMYDDVFGGMFRDIYVSGNVNSQIAIVASFGLDNNMPPTPDILPVLLELGAGGALQYWETHSNPGSEVGSSNAYVSFPANYVLLGYSAWSYGQGYEKYDYVVGQQQITTTVTGTFTNIVPA
ncbi:MAG TPA: hypothetical protein VHN37_13265 [Actinomycetota bacterium]|nr:hypothetical protein [Actinomycetota bacterium]